MKRAWPYAVALAVVVTACYLALAPLLRSVSPGPTTSAASLLPASNSTTVSQAKLITDYVAPNHGGTKLVSNLASAKKKAKKTSAPPTNTATSTTGFASGRSTTSPSTSTGTTPKKPSKSGSSSSKTGASSVGGSPIDQGGTSGFAGDGKNGTLPGGSKVDSGQ